MGEWYFIRWKMFLLAAGFANPIAFVLVQAAITACIQMGTATRPTCAATGGTKGVADTVAHLLAKLAQGCPASALVFGIVHQI